MSLADKHVEKPRIRPREYIKIRGANEHNLKNLDVDIPRNELVVLTGLSGSGKSSLAFDTIYAEGQRRYMESLSSYARQFLGQMEKPNVEKIEGLSPAISIDLTVYLFVYVCFYLPGLYYSIVLPRSKGKKENRFFLINRCTFPAWYRLVDMVR